MGGLLVDFFGLGAFFFPILLLYAGLKRFFSHWTLPPWRWAGIGILSFVCLALVSTQWAQSVLNIGDVVGGGYLGSAIHSFFWYYFKPIGASLFFSLLFIVSLQLLFGVTLETVGQCVGQHVSAAWAKQQERREQAALVVKPESDNPKTKRRFSFKLLSRKQGEDDMSSSSEDALQYDDVDALPAAFEEVDFDASAVQTSDAVEDASLPASSTADSVPKKKKPKLVTSKQEQPTASAKPPKPKTDSNMAKGEFVMPPTELLTEVPPLVETTNPEILREQATKLVTCLNDFGIQGDVSRIMPGPVVTMFELKPAPGIKISRIANLTDDLALATKAMAIRIEAPIPGKDSVGIELPNKERQTVYLRDILESKVFDKSASHLTLSIGKDIQGHPFVADLAKMPHLLVAGATGSGKSVCINGILLSILYKATPDEVKLLLVDPKRIELAVYADLPHLVHPVVTDMSLAKSALDWAVHEMDRRYEAMAKLGVRNIAGYNERIAKMGKNKPEEFADFERMPFLVIIIDELADLMMTASKEVEASIVRLAQLARAAGIHIILATQRPSVDVVTGLIKANFPTRIAFQVTSRHDSRTILDSNGAENLLGRGDMLFKPSGGKMVRMHGAFVSDEDTAQVVDYWKEQRPAKFELDFAAWQQEQSSSSAGGGPPDGDDVTSDPMYGQAVEFVMEQGKASISFIQRRFRIGFNRAARYIEQMERDGILGPQEGSKPRAVIKKD